MIRGSRWRAMCSMVSSSPPLAQDGGVVDAGRERAVAQVTSVPVNGKNMTPWCCLRAVLSTLASARPRFPQS